MTLTSGSRLGNYEIVAPIGAGGMGEVYRARDPRLGRDVAIKVLPEAFAADPERLARLQREAQMLAALNHPNIAGIHALEESGAVRFLVLEFVPGETLAELLSVRGAMPVDEALGICGQLAEALEAAHERGIIHRDLKPANIKLTPEGKVKVLDFGLAKALAGDVSSSDMATSPTLSMAATRAGVLLGTAAYMSPEQARGKSLDRRTDIWAFGCVLFELLTGKQAFAGDTVSDAVAVILTRDPDWQLLPPSTPPRVRELLRRCFQKDAGHRLRDMGDARIEIEEIRAGSSSGIFAPTATASANAVLAPASPTSFWARPVTLGRAATSALGLVLLASLLVWLGARSRQPTAGSLLRVSIPAPKDEAILQINQPLLTISPDSRYVVFVAGRGGESQLYMRPLDQLEATPIPGTRQARSPFFSHDGEWIGFFAEGKLKKISVRGGSAVPLCDASPEDGRGASWGDDGFIYFTPGFVSGVFRISEAGGKPEVVTTLDEKVGERTHRWPEALPGGKALLYTLGSIKSPDYYFDAQIVVKSFATGQSRTLVDGGTNPHYLPSGHLVYSTVSGLVAAPFDLQKLEITGPPVPMPEQILASVDTGAMHYAISREGAMAYIPGEALNAEHALAWVDMKGKVERLAAPLKNYYEPVLSPDGKRVAVTLPSSRNDDIWVLDIARNTLTRLTFGPASATGPLWTPDGTRIVYSAERDGKVGLFWKAADGSGAEERLFTTGTAYPVPDSFSSDGKLIAFTQIDPARQGDIYVLSLGDRKATPFLTSPFNETQGTLSPDGRWMAYVSTESGNEALFVQAFPGPGGKYQISPAGTGGNPQWSRDGKQLFFRGPSDAAGKANVVGKVDITTKPSFSASTPHSLFPVSFGGLRPQMRLIFSLAPDSKRILMVEGSDAGGGIQHLNVVFGWTDELKRRAATARK